MIRSMTGFGLAEGTWQQWAIRAEARSVNQARLKLSIRLPDMLRLREIELAKIVEGRVARGHVHLSIDCSLGGDAIDLLIDKDKLRGYVRMVKEAADAEGVAAHAEVGGMMSLPGVMSTEGLLTQVRESLWPEVLSTAQEAVEEMIRMREAEGSNLAEQLDAICTDARKRTGALEAGVDGSLSHYQARLMGRVRQLLEGSQTTVDEDVMAREVAILAERSDVSEEIVRMGSHLDQFQSALQSHGEPVGKKLEFLSQEMLREANTMVAKLPSTEQVQQAIEIKLDVNRLLEQVRNVE